jgi:hypothetical protein
MSEFLKDGDKPLQLQMSVLIFTGLLPGISHLPWRRFGGPLQGAPNQRGAMAYLTSTCHFL